MKVCPSVRFLVHASWRSALMPVAPNAAAQLEWTGSDWVLDGRPVEWPVVAMDLQGVMLLALHRRPATRTWVLARRGDAAGDWLALRRAVYSRATRQPKVTDPVDLVPVAPDGSPR